MITANAAATADITVDIIIYEDVNIANDSYVWYKDQHK